MIFASPSATWSEIQGLLATDDVTLNPGSVYPGSATIGTNSSAGIVVPAGRKLVISGATIDWTAVVNQTADTQGTASILLNAGSQLLGDGVVQGPASRALAGSRANHSHRLVYADNGASFATPLNILIEDVTFRNGPNQAIQFNNARGITVRNPKTPAPLVKPTCSGAFVGHYIDLDVTANGRVTRDITFEGGDYDAFGQEALKLENVQTIRVVRDPRNGALAVFRSYVTITQDVTVAGSLSDVEMEAEWQSRIALSNLRRQWNGSAIDNLGAGTVTIRGRFTGNGMILGGQTSAGITGPGSTDAEMFANLIADRCTFEGKNSHMVAGITGTAWMTRCSGIKPRVTVYVRNASNPKYPFTTVLPINADNVGAEGAGNTVSSINTGLTAAGVAAAFDLANRGVVVNLPQGTLTGAQNVGASFSISQNLPITWQADGAGCTLDGAGSTSSGFSITGTNTGRQVFDNITCQNFINSTSTRGWTINSTSANVELYRVRSVNCNNTSGGGGGGRAQNYASLYLGPGVEASGCSTQVNGGGFLIDASATSVCTIEGARAINCTAASGGGMRIGSAYAAVRSFEAVNCTGVSGSGGISASWSVAAVTQTIEHFTGRGNVGNAGGGNDAGVFVGTAGSKLILRRSVLGSGGLVMNKTGPGDLDYGELHRDSSSSVSVASGTNTDLGGNALATVNFSGASTSTTLVWDSPGRNAANVAWTAGTQRPYLTPDGSWLQVDAASKTNMGARV